jgi:hypothetical protein
VTKKEDGMAKRFECGRAGILALAGSALCVVLAGAPAHAQCVGDCNGNDVVTINELILGVNIALGTQPVSACPAFANAQDMVNIAQLIKGVNNALNGCPATPTPGEGTATATATTGQETPTPNSTATHTPEGPTDTPAATPTATPIFETPSPVSTPTDTPTGGCPLDPGTYTLHTTGGSLTVATFSPFPFPAGGTTVQEVGPGDANCVHSVVVAFPGGLNVPPFCVPALGATTLVTQTGCGVGRIDSNGGSDFTVGEVGDTSASVGDCHVLQDTCPAVIAPDSSGLINVTVGNGSPDECAGGQANAIVTIPVNTLTWVAADGMCPDSDGEYNPDVDTKLAEFPQTLDLTTDTASATFADIDGNGCFKSGLGPVGPFANNAFCVAQGNPLPCCTTCPAANQTGCGTCTGPAKGSCIDIDAKTVTVAASGTIFSSGGPTYDLLFATVQSNSVTGPEPSTGATCDNPPVIDFTGTAQRCLQAQ